MSDYLTFLRQKIKLASFSGFDVPLEQVNPALKPHTRDIVRWAVKGGRRAIFASFGLHKTATQLEILRLIGAHRPGLRLQVLPLGVRQEFTREVAERFKGDFSMDLRFIRSDSEIGDERTVYLTNYESVREGKVTPSLFRAASLDEASILRSFGSKTYQEFLPAFDAVEFRFVATATPSPNRYKELIHYAGYLGVMDTGQALTRFFQRDSEKAGNLTLYPHKEQEFWLWVASWAVFIQRPSDLGHSDEGYVLPDLDVRWHEIPSDYEAAGEEKNGQGLLVPDLAMGLSAAAREKRDSMPARVEKVRELVSEAPDEHFIVWHDLEDERHAIQSAIPEAVSVWGSQDLEEREDRIVGFSDGQFRVLSTKPVIAGSGCNFQRHCSREVFAGVGFKFNDFIQAIHRVHRFGQSKKVRIDIIHTEAEREVVRALQTKWRQHDEMQARMAELIRTYGFNDLAMQETLARTIGVDRQEASGRDWTLANNDCVDEAMRQPDNSVGLIVTSIPFANHYEYSPSYNDFGHTEDNEHFWAQMDFLTPELLRILEPGRLYCCHVKDRILFGNVTGQGVPTVSPFHAEAIFHGLKHGFQYLGMVTVVTDVVRENNQTYRLSWSEQCKDGTKMGVGSPEYILLFRKPQTDLSRGYADTPVRKDKSEYSLARWQIDAHAFWRSSGNRLLTTEELAMMGPDKLAKVFTDQSLRKVYDYAEHVHIGEQLAERGALPTQFMSLAPGSHHPDVWHDVVRMRTLNGEQSSRNVEKHVCLARGSLVLTRERGYVPIETVEPGEHTLTHRGRWRRVLVARQTGVRPTITVRAQGVPGLRLTPDHKLWARVTDWVRERDGAERTEPQWVEAQNTLGGYVNLKLPDVAPNAVPDHIWWIAGRWLADGHYGARGEVVISCSFDEVEGLIDSLGERAGTVHRAGTAAQIRIRDRDGAVRAALEGCGEGAEGKRMPPAAMELDESAARALLTGYLSGDGHFRADRGRWMATTVSRALALGVAALAQRVFGVVASIHQGRPEREAEIQGRRVRCRQEWVISFDVATGQRKKPFVLEDGAWKKVRGLEDAGEAEVWCLRVEEDESFTAEGCIVKNCPLQLDIVDRLIERYSNKGDLVYDPFCGLGTVPYRAVLKGRKGRGSELNPAYWRDSVHYLQAAEREVTAPTLFDFAELDAA